MPGCEKAAVLHGPFVPMQREERRKRERWTLAHSWPRSKPTRGVCASICVLIDEMNSGSGKLILAVADPPPPPTPPPPHTLLSPLRLCFLLPAGRLVLLACFLSLKLKERGEGGGSAGGGGGSGAATQTRWDILFSPSLIRLTRCLLATG